MAKTDVDRIKRVGGGLQTRVVIDSPAAINILTLVGGRKHRVLMLRPPDGTGESKREGE